MSLLLWVFDRNVSAAIRHGSLTDFGTRDLWRLQEQVDTAKEEGREAPEALRGLPQLPRSTEERSGFDFDAARDFMDAREATMSDGDGSSSVDDADFVAAVYTSSDDECDALERDYAIHD